MSDYSNTHWMKDLPDNFHCQPDKPLVKLPDPFTKLVEFKPEYWTVDKVIIRNALDCLETGLEYARQCLSEHDVSLGRTNKKNKSWAETIESDIRLIEKSIKDLKIAEVSHTTHYP